MAHDTACGHGTTLCKPNSRITKFHHVPVSLGGVDESSYAAGSPRPPGDKITIGHCQLRELFDQVALTIALRFQTFKQRSQQVLPRNASIARESHQGPHDDATARANEQA